MAPAGTGATASASVGGSHGHVLHLSFLQDPGQPPDPDVYYAAQGLLLTTNTYEGLVTYKPATAAPVIVPVLATSWHVSGDHRVYTFELRHGVHFHDGTAFTSAAVGASFTRRLKVGQGPSYMVAGVAWVKPEGPYKVVITLKEPNFGFLDWLASPYGPKMMSPTALAGHAGKDYAQTYLATHDIGTGPYLLTEAKVGVAYQLKAFPGYWGPKPYFTTVDIPVVTSALTQEIDFNDGQLDAILHDLQPTEITSYSANAADSVYSLPLFETELAYLNPTAKLLATAKLRLAVEEAVNIAVVDKAAFGSHGVIATQMYPLHMLPDASSDPQDIAYNPSVLKSAIKDLPASQKTVTVGYDPSAPVDNLVANLIGAQLRVAGVTTEVVGYPTAQIFGFQARPSRGPGILIQSPWPDAADPYTWAHDLYQPSGGLDFFNCPTPGANALFNTAVSTGSPSAYAKIGEIAKGQGCWLNLAFRDDVMVTQKWLTGVAQAHNVATPQSLDLAVLGAA